MSDVERQLQEAKIAVAADEAKPRKSFGDHMASRLLNVYIIPFGLMFGGLLLVPTYAEWFGVIGIVWMFAAAFSTRP